MSLCFLGLGSNQNNPRKQLLLATKAIKTIPKTVLLKIAPIYKSIPAEKRSQPDFYNTAIAIKTNLSPFQLLQYCKAIECAQLRTSKIPKGPRTLDIDILLFGNRSLNYKNLTIPHPKLTHRDFALLPILAIYPSVCLPDQKELQSFVENLPRYIF